MASKFEWLEMKAHEGRKTKRDYNEMFVFQRKYDGSRHYFINGSHLGLEGCSLFSVRGVEKREAFRHIFEELKQLGNVLVDLEIYIEGGSVLDLNKKANHPTAKCCVFDVLSNGNDLRGMCFRERTAVLNGLFEGKQFKSIHLPESWNDFDVAWRSVEDRKLEGLMAKCVTGKYFSGKRSHEWLKIKRKLCADVEILGHEAGSDKGTFLCRTDEGIDIRVSGTSLDILGYWNEHKPKRMEVSYMYKTESGKYFQPVFSQFKE